MNAISRVDLLVVGAGPAGCAAAVALGRAGYRTLLLDRPSPHARVGEGLPGSARPVLAALGLLHAVDPPSAIPWVGLSTSWGQETTIDRPFVFGPGEGWLLDRQRFDDALLAIAAAVGEVAVCDPGTDVTLDQDVEWAAAWVEAGKARRVDARFVIDATGRSRVVARQSEAPVTVVDRLVGWHAILDRPSPSSLETTVCAAAQGWWYAAPIPDDRAVVCFFSDADLMTRTDVVALAKEAALPGAFAASMPRWTPRPHPSGTSFLAAAVGRGWLAVGDAALAQDPLAGHGLEFALRSGLRGAQAVASWLQGDAAPANGYAEMVARRAQAFVMARRSIYGREDRWPRSPFWKRRRDQ